MTLRKLTLAMTAGVFTLSACTLTDPNNPNQKAQTGALVGAALGAAIGASSGDNSSEKRRRAIVGAALGGGLGALGGHQLDKQAAELRAQLGDQVGVQNTGDRLIVTMPQDILFATNSATLSGSLRQDLTTVASSLQQYPSTNVIVVGHTDNTGTADYNLGLSERRAQSVESEMIIAGVPPSRLRAIGRGEDQPIADNLTPQGRAQNRRVEIVITPTAQ